MTKEYNKPYNCPIEASLSVLGGKWKAIIIYHIMEHQVLRFGELKKILPQISQRMLTSQLRELEKDKIINRKIYQQIPPKVEYSLSKYGNTLKPILIQLCAWGEIHIKNDI